MRKYFALIFLTLFLFSFAGNAQEKIKHDTLSSHNTYVMEEVVVTGTRNETDIRHLSQTVLVVNRAKIEQMMQPSLLPHRVDSAGRTRLSPAPVHRAEGIGIQRFPLSDSPRNIYVPTSESGP